MLKESLLHAPRGGHNKKPRNESFFRNWSPAMAYVVGYAFADGSIIDSAPSRTSYLRFHSIDKDLLEQIKTVMGYGGKIHCLRPRAYPNASQYLSKPCYYLSIGSRILCTDLQQLGVTPRKSLCMTLPDVPERYFGHFVRGFLDGDGCIHADTHSGRLQVHFTSGSREFLTGLSHKLTESAGVKIHNIHKSTRSFQLKYSTKEALLVLNFIYSGLQLAPYLHRKYAVYENWHGTQVVREQSAKLRYGGSIPPRASQM